MGSTVNSFLQFLQYEKRYSEKTVLAYRTDLLQFAEFLRATYDGLEPPEANHSIIRSWVVQLVEQKLNAPSVNRKIACLRSYYKFLQKQGLIQKNPMLKIKILKAQKRLPQFVNEPEMVNLLDHTQFDDSFEGKRDKLVLELFYGTGIRLSELLNLKEVNIDPRKRTIKVLGKRNKERVIPFAESLLPVMKDYVAVRNREVGQDDLGLLFVTSKGKRCYPMMIYRSVKKYLRLTSTGKRSPHVLRHTYATHLLNKGAEINAVKDLLGHSSLAATQVYTHNSIEKLKKAYDQAHPKA